MKSKIKNQKLKIEVTAQQVAPFRDTQVRKPAKSTLKPEQVTAAARALVPDIDFSYELKDVRLKVFSDRYSLKDAEGKPLETRPEEMWQRVAGGIAMMEKTPALQREWAQKFYEIMTDFKFVPAGRILSGAGAGYEVTFFNCYVIPSPKDSRQGIMENITHTVEIQSRAGGVGVNLSSLRPSGARVRKVNGWSSGPVNWAKLYSSANHDVIQQGGSRRGALMLMLNDWHPDVINFIKAKEDGVSIPGANLSICISDKFMQAVKNDEDWTTRFPDTQDPEYDELWNGDIEDWEALGKPVKIAWTMKAKEIWDMICYGAWKAAEPGLHFLERSNKWGNTWYFEKLISTNPCGEQPLGEWAVCNLGAVNLGVFVDDKGTFDYDSLDKTIRTAMRFMDNVVDANYYFLEENEIKAKDIRRTGIGTMGLADALIKMKLRYGSAEAMPVIEKIYATIRDASYDVSTDLAKEKGSFPKFDAEKYLQGHFIKTLPANIREKIAKQGIRNAVILTQAPTGTTSLLAGASSGIEPIFDFSYTIKSRMGTDKVYHPLFGAWKEQNPGDDVVAPDYFVNANGLTPMDHVKVQGLIQGYTDSSISKTANAPFDHTVEDVKELYMAAYDLGCKGVTYFRDGSRSGVLYHEEEEKKEEAKPAVIEEVRQMRPLVLRGRTYEIQTPLGKAYVTINKDQNDHPFEVFITIGKGGMHTMADAEAIGRLVSISLQSTHPSKRLEVANKIAQSLRGIGGSNHIGFGKNRVMSLADAVAKVLTEDLAMGSDRKVDDVVEQEPLQLSTSETFEATATSTAGKTADICSECGNATLIMEEGCMKCYSCGYSKC